MSDTSRIWYPTARAHGTSRFICIETESEGLADPKGKQHLLPPDASEEAIGLAVLDALAHSRQISWLELETLMWGRRGTGKERYEKWAADLQQRYGYKSRATLFKNMNFVGIKHQNGTITFTPMMHIKLQAWQGGRNEGIEDVVISFESLSQQIGAALKLAFSRCV